MQPVLQTETELGRGNCLSACLASILDLPADSVPNFRLAADQFAAAQEWLATRGLYAVRFVADRARLFVPSGKYCVLLGKSPRRDVGHAVVGVTTPCGFDVAHDPHPSGGGLDGDPWWVLFLATNLHN